MSTDNVPRTPITIEDLVEACDTVLARLDPIADTADIAYLTTFRTRFAEAARQSPGAAIDQIIDPWQFPRFSTDQEGTA